MWKKWSIGFVAVMLLLTGCSGEAMLVRDSVVTSLEKPNFDYQGTLKLTGDLEKLQALLSKEEESGDLLTALQVLAGGLTISGSQYDLKNAKLVVQANDDKVLREKNLWTGEQKASIQMQVNNDQVYLKTPLDSKYLLLETGASSMANLSVMAGNNGTDAAKLKAYQEKANTLMIEFIKDYISKYGYKLSAVKNLGTETVNLPNGESVKTTHVSITLDVRELLQILFYSAQDATTNQDVKKFAVEMMILTYDLSEGSDPTGKKLSEVEKRSQAELTVTEGLESLKKWLDTEGKVYTPEQVATMLKEIGLQSLSWKLDYFIDEDKLPIRQQGVLSVTIQSALFGIADPITLHLESDQYAWNFGKSAPLTAPSVDQTVTQAQLVSGKDAIKAFHEKGFLRAIIETFRPEQELLLP